MCQVLTETSKIATKISAATWAMHDTLTRNLREEPVPVSDASDITQSGIEFFWYQFLLTNRTCSVFVPVYRPMYRFSGRGFDADFLYVCQWVISILDSSFTKSKHCVCLQASRIIIVDIYMYSRLSSIHCCCTKEERSDAYEYNNVNFAKGQVHQKYRYTRSTGTPEVQVHQKCRYTRSTGTPEVQVHQKYRYTRRTGTPEVLVHQKGRYTRSAGTPEGQVHQKGKSPSKLATISLLTSNRDDFTKVCRA